MKSTGGKDVLDAAAAAPGDVRAARVESLERAFTDELTGSMSLNLRASALAGGAAIAILLLVLFASTWLDDNRWELSDVSSLLLKEVLLPGSIWALVITLALATAAAWPRRHWSWLQKERTLYLAEGRRDLEALVILDMVLIERASNERKGRRLRRAAFFMAIATGLVIAQCMAFAFDANPVDPPRTDAPVSVEDDPAVGLSEQRQLELARAYAPRVWLHARDPYRPLDPLAFIKGSSLVWHRPNGGVEVASRGSVKPERLGRHCGDALEGCYEHDQYLARELTRPFHGGPHRPRDLNRPRGFALVPNGKAQEGVARAEVPGVPMLWDVRRVRERILIAYWFYFGYSRPWEFRARAGGDIAAHDGDWENIEVVLDPDGRKPIRVLFYGHGAPARVEWRKVCKALPKGKETCRSDAPGHPVVYSARESHASYDRPGSRKVHGAKGTATDHTERGILWEPWRGGAGLRYVRDEPWYGFGGAWGRAKDPEGTTGPLGPSRWKLPEDPDPGDFRSAH